MNATVISPGQKHREGSFKNFLLRSWAAFRSPKHARPHWRLLYQGLFSSQSSPHLQVSTEVRKYNVTTRT
ncbi:SPOC domain-containing protein [Psidium guajava]|nr:SPOC domain-containing protein [Psidium guajava]